MDNSDTGQFIPHYLGAFEGSWTEQTPAEQVRFVVLDTETTSTDARTARLITIGALAVNGGQILLGDAFEEMIALGYTSSSVAVHGITRDESREGVSEAAAIESFLKYLRDGGDCRPSHRTRYRDNQSGSGASFRYQAGKP